MKILLTSRYMLTDDHAASSYGQAVLVNRVTGEFYGPGDIIKAYPSWEYELVADVVRRFTEVWMFSPDELRVIEGFIRLGRLA